MINAFDVYNQPSDSEKPNNYSFFDILSDAFKATKGQGGSVESSSEMFNIAEKLHNPAEYGIDNYNEIERLRSEYDKLYNERQQNQLLSQEARKRLEENGHDWISSATSLGSSLPDMARTMPAAIAAGIPTGGLGTAATIAAGLYGMYRGGRGASIEAFEKVLNDGGSLEQAMDAYNNSLLANSIAEAPGEALNLVGAGRLAKMLKGTKAAQKALGTGVGRIGADLIKDPAKAVGTAVAGKFGRTAGRAAGVATHALGETATEELTEHFQNYNSDIQGQKAMGKDTDFFDMNNFTKYLNSDEAAQTTKDVFFSTLLLGGAPAAITSNQMLGNGYGNAAAVNASDTLGKILQKSDVQGKLDEKGVDFIKDTAADILKEQGREVKSEDLKLEDAFRIYTDDLINDAVANGVDKATAERNAVVDGYSALFGDTNREGTISETVHDLLKENYDLKDFAVVNNAVKEETLQEQANKQQDSSSNTQTNNETQTQGQETNSENVTFKTSNKTLGEEVASQTAGQGYINNRKTTGNAETNSPETNTSNTTPSTNQLFRKEVGGFREVSEKDEGDGNKLYTNGERQIRITQRPDGKFSVSDEADIYKPAAVKDTIEEAYNFMEQIDNGTATVAGERFMEGSKVGEKLPDEDGVIANKEQNVNGDGIEVNSVKGWYNYVDSQRGTKAAVPARMARAVARGIKRFGLEGSNIKLVMKRNNATGSYGRADIQTDPETGAINAVVELYAGSDVITVIHEFAHVGYYNMKADRRAAYDRWALDSAVDYAIHALVPGVNVNELKADNEFMAGLLNVMSAIDDEYNIHEEYIDRGNAFAEKIYQMLSGAIQVKENGQVVTKEVGELAGLVQIAPTVRYALDETYRQQAQVDSYTQEIIQRAIEERFAWDFSSWYAEGYTKGKKPATFIQRILQEVCQSLGRYLHVINVVSQRLESEGFDQIKEKNSDKIINGFDLFNEMSINTNDNAVAGYDPRTLKTWVNREQPVTETPSTETTNVEQPQQQMEQQNTPNNPFARWSDEQIMYMLDKETEGTTEGTRRALQEEAVRRGLVRTPEQEADLQNRQNFMNALLSGVPMNQQNNQDTLMQNTAQTELDRRFGEPDYNGQQQNPVGWDNVPNQENTDNYTNVPSPDDAYAQRIMNNKQEQQQEKKQTQEKQQPSTEQENQTKSPEELLLQSMLSNVEPAEDNAMAAYLVDKNNGDVNKIKKQLLDAYRKVQGQGVTSDKINWLREVGRMAVQMAQRQNTLLLNAGRGQSSQQNQTRPDFLNQQKKQEDSLLKNLAEREAERRKQEEARKRQEEQQRKEEAKRKEEEARRKEEERKREEEAKRKEEEERVKKEEEQKKKEEVKKKKETKRYRDRSEVAKLKTEEDVMQFVKQNIKDFDELEANEGIEDAAMLVDDVEFSAIDEDDATIDAQYLFQDIMEEKPSDYIDQLITVVTNARKRMSNPHDFAMLVEVERKLRKFKADKLLGAPQETNKDTVVSGVRSIYEKVLRPYFRSVEHTEYDGGLERELQEEKKAREKQDRTKKQKTEKTEQERKKKEEARKQKEEEKRKKQGNLTDEEYKEYEELSKAKKELGSDQFTDDDLVRWSELDEKKNGNSLDADGKVISVERFMKKSLVDRQKELQEKFDEVDPNRVELNAASYFDNKSREYNKKIWKEKFGLTDKDVEKLYDKMDNYLKQMIEKIYPNHPIFEEWNSRIPLRENGLPIQNAFRSNGEYDLNIDLGTFCPKKEGMDAVLTYVAKNGWGENLGPTQLEQLADLLKENGVLVPCKMCFVEMRRIRALDSMKSLALNWHSVLKGIGLDDGVKFNFETGAKRTLSKEKEQEVRKILDLMTSDDENVRNDAFKKYIDADDRRVEIVKINKNGKKVTTALDNGITVSKMYKIASLIKQDLKFAGELNPVDFLYTEEVDKLYKAFAGHTSVREFLSGIDGAASAKPLEGIFPYDPLSWKDIKNFNEDTILKNRGANREGNIDFDNKTENIYDIGGVRSQSFSDFIPLFIFDYVQNLAELEARALPQHIYTKVPSAIKFFADTNTMMNMSFVPKITVDENFDRDHAGLVKNKETGEWEYDWAEESFPIEKAYEYREKYDKTAGIIAIGVSKYHILKLLADPRIDQVIPWHKSGMPMQVQKRTNFDKATDYTDAQTMSLSKEKIAEIKRKTGYDAGVYLNYSRILFEKGDPKRAAKEYLKRCGDFKVKPVFEEFSDNENYYKVLEDFRGYDKDGNPILQKPVRLKLTDGWLETLDKDLTYYEQSKSTVYNTVHNPRFQEQVERIMTPWRLDGEIREEMISRLKSALGTKSVETLAKKDFFDKLEEIYDKKGMGKETRQKVEAFRTGNGTLYGFTDGKKIYLNENTFNSNTPAHEFTHIWAKVAQVANNKLWKEGVGLLKRYEKDTWKSVLNDALYADIRDIEDAIASEVLARAIGRENEHFIEEFTNYKNKKYQRKKKTLAAQIKKWWEKIFNSIRSLFTETDNTPLTYDEFMRMPLKALWDQNENKKFKDALKRIKVERINENTQAQTESAIRKEVTRYMKRPVKNTRDIEYMDSLYKDNFYKVGKKIGFNTKRITDAYKVIEFLNKSINSRTFRDDLLYLNPKDEKMMGQRVKDFARLNHQTNEKLWEMNLRDKKNKRVFGKNLYRNLDGKWMQEISDKDAKFSKNTLIDDMVNNAGLAGLEYKLGDLMQHDLLYALYRNKLTDIPVQFIDYNMVENGEVEEVKELDFAAAYSYKTKRMYINVEAFFGDQSTFDSFGTFEKLESGEEDQMKEAISDINDAIDEIMPFLLHETQHAVQDIEFGTNPSANRVVALVLHSDMKNVYQRIKGVKDNGVLALAKKEMKDARSIANFLDKQNKNETEQRLQNILEDYMDSDEFYYTDLNEMEAYDTQHRYNSDGTSLPLTMAERGAYQNLESGTGMVTRRNMKCSVNGKNYPFKDTASLAIMEAKYKKDFYYIGQRMRIDKNDIDKAYNVKDELAKKDGKYFIKLDVANDKDLDRFIKINDAVKATWWIRGLQDTSKNSIYSRGVYVDMYGKWNYTIDHSNATFNRDGFNNTISYVFGKPQYNTRRKMKLADILNFPELFDEYPELREMEVQFKKTSEYSGQYDPSKQQINLSAIYFSLDDADSLGTLLHEIQHAIQHKEGELLGGIEKYRQAMLIDKKEAENLINIVKRSGVITEESGKRILNAYNYIVSNPNIFEKMFVKKGKRYLIYTINAANSLDNSSVGKLTDVEKKQLQVLLNTILNGKTAGEVDEYTIEGNYDKRYVEMTASDINIPTRPDWGVDGYDPQKTPPLLGRKSYLENRGNVFYRFQKGEKLTTQERAEVSSEILNTAFPNVRFQFAWHSTPHDFDAFTLDHLLEGEGAMAHGWGLYFAKSLPDNYRNYFKRFNIEEIKVKNNGKDITSTILDDIFDENDYVKTEVKTPNDLKTELERQKKHLSARQEYLEAEMDTMQEEYNLDDDELEIEQYQQQMIIDGIEATKILCDDIINDINNGKVEVSVKEGKARFLHVDIPNDDVLLRERARFGEQPKKVQEAIRKVVNKLDEDLTLSEREKEDIFNGNDIYEELSRIASDYGGRRIEPGYEFDVNNPYDGQEIVSRMLNKYGCRGISYNGQWDGECVVVFDDKAIDIINKFKREEGKWVSVKPQSQKQELTDTQKQRVQRKLQEKKQNSTVRYQTTSSKITDDQIAREHSNTLSVSFTESAQKNQTNRKIMQYFDKRNRDFERTIDPNTKKVTYTRRRPEPHHTQNINYNGINDKVVTKKEKYGSKFKVRQEMFNDKEAIKKLASDLGVPEAYQKMMVQSLQGQKANVALTEGVEYNGKKTKGLYEIMGKIPEELQPRFTEYCVAFRILDFEKYRPDIVQKMTADEARDVIRDVQNDKEIADLFEKTRKDFVEYNIAMLHESLVTNGVISQELFDNMVAKDPNFVPLSKIMDDDVDFGYQSARGARSLIDIKSPIKSVKSSVREIKNPFAEMEKRTYEYYNTGAKNKAALTLINDVVNKIDVLVDGDKIAKGQGIIRKVKIQEKDGKIITKPDPKNRIFYVCNNGVHEFYQAADPVVYAAMKNFTEQQAQEMSKVLGTMDKISKGMARVVRESATITYDFGGNNGIRDTLGAFVASEHGFIPIYDTIWGMKEVLKGDKSHYYKEYSGQVGQYAKSTRGELLADNTFKVPSRQLYEGYIKEVKKNYAILTNSKYTTTQRAKAFLKMILGAPLMAVYTNAQNFNEIIEQGTRVAEYKNARQGYNGIMDRLEKGGFAWDVDVSKDTVDKAVAAYKALDVTLFFQQHGNLGKKLNQYTPFFNAYLLGLEKTLNCLDLLYSGKDAMNQTNKTLQKEMLFKVVFFALMGIAASAAGAGDDDYEEAPDWEKNTFWIFPNGIRFGRDEIFGRTIGRIAEEAYTQARHKKFDVKKFGGIAIDAFSPNNIMPTILDIYGGLYMNRDSFTKRDIVPERMKSLPGPKQIDMYTSNMAKDFSSVMYALGINVSAKQVHYLLQKHFTNTFKYAEDVYSLIRGKEDATMARGYDKNDTTGQIVGALKDDVPRPLNRITGKFITNRTQYQSVNEFEDEYKEIRGKERAKDLNPLTKEEQAKWKRFEEAEKKMNKIRKKLKEIRENKNLNKYQRQEKAERLFQEQVRIAKKALGKE